ncbi:hypothetical protein [Halalkalibacter akibai]|uniref:Uncharacterized protein n=1 Tax=Halalkalibacter akibai (strain ATCC 43226 / DSM 21942 / CIP 109018 / JCM 9157 / 1139) TaxID=1236973 RepID=W4QW70_HALA3|nr:hypothetical protein [Halalkalibacter akibai]GAE35883.1 hypothetical protein JCM9157_3020 [Halalkalibacter akibai JCM 9157]
MMIEQINVNTELFQWLNKKTDLNSSQVDLVDGFIFMLKKINHHKSIRLVDDKKLHLGFGARTIGHSVMN